MSKLTSIFTGGGEQEKAAKRAEAAQAEALRKAEETRVAQEAATARLRVQEDNREADLDKKAASQRRATVASRRGRSGLQFTGSNAGLKTTFGG